MLRRVGLGALRKSKTGRAFTRGAWKSIYLAESLSGVLSRTSCQHIRIGARTRPSLADGDFDVAVKVYLDADRPASLQKATLQGQLVRRRPVKNDF